ncbi:ester cyclase [Pseudofrankia inefficax]|uniref:Ester cyclase n=1 Tax=Pseudofrankia inefficax (strain DSM 45817 / CECT 9037 / DDB 130130 / EuI1c) TaxID=298654 RepID=E3JCW8_PSEI1|nr:ester cyclase [Pseudofrankia inefficax]ADP81107.1 protein of unknown function DUF1486 [Pseudofrankia inefficax]
MSIRAVVDSETLEANKAVVRRYFEEGVNQASPTVIDEIIALDAVDETRGPDAATLGREGFRQHAAWLAATADNVRTTITELVAEGDRVVAFWTISGYAKGLVFGVPGNGRYFEGISISSFTIRDGLVTRYSVLPDRLGVIAQLTAADDPAPGANGDEADEERVATGQVAR